VLIADEPTSGLDVLVEGEILDLLDRLRADLGLALLVVSHDLPVIERVADRIAVMQGGDLVEVGSTIDVISSPRHPYTRTLVDSIVRLDAAVLEGAS
ncbi:MAG: ABC transporter, partial [Rhodococcus sp. (in: high G+C Gram-positive bacteria)]